MQQVQFFLNHPCVPACSEIKSISFFWLWRGPLELGLVTQIRADVLWKAEHGFLASLFSNVMISHSAGMCVNPLQTVSVAGACTRSSHSRENGWLWSHFNLGFVLMTVVSRVHLYIQPPTSHVLNKFNKFKLICQSLILPDFQFHHSHLFIIW